MRKEDEKREGDWESKETIGTNRETHYQRKSSIDWKLEDPSPPPRLLFAWQPRLRIYVIWSPRDTQKKGNANLYMTFRMENFTNPRVSIMVR